MASAERPVTAASSRTTETRVLSGIRFHLLSEGEVIQHIVNESRADRGGWVVTPNIDICRQARSDPAALSLVQSASLVVPDGMPLLWIAKVRGEPLVERVTGSSLIFTLTGAAAQVGLSIYLLGGVPGVPEAAAENLTRMYPGLKVAGTDAPAIGFDKSIEGVDAVRTRIRDAAPNIVYVGLGFPKQEQLIAKLAPALPAAWFIGCGAAIPFAAGTVSRAPEWMQRSGLEWVHRLMREPRRLFRRYLILDLPFATELLIGAVAERGKSKVLSR
jgi:N-acetylglucosaminyldiphosphoundecaprenol N-acetyl-beta-D-mannosaminyltransferase